VVLGLLLLGGRIWADFKVSAGTCPPVHNTPRFTIVYGTVTLDGTDASVGAVVTAVSPRDDVVGCFVVETAGNYGAMYVYGEDTSVTPSVPGMRDGEVIAFRVNGEPATANPELTWSNDRNMLHQVDLSATSAPCYNFAPPSTIGAEDMGAVAICWRDPDQYAPQYDIAPNVPDGVINILDVMTVQTHWGEQCQ